MFRNRALKISIDRNRPETTVIPKVPLSPDKFNKIALEQTRNLAVIVGIGYTGKVVLLTARDLTLMAAAKKFS